MECGCVVSYTPEIIYDLKPLNANFKKRETDSDKQKRTSYVNSSHAVRVFEVLDTLRKDEVFCDIKLETEDGSLVYCHKVVLASATPYFQVMFTNFEESKMNHVILRELDSTALQLLVDFIYTSQIIITEDTVQVLLQAANLLQLEDVKEACCDFLLTLLNPKNFLGFKALVSLYNCKEYLSSFKSYVLQYFSELVEDDEFLNLSCDELIELISFNELNDSSEEKMFFIVGSEINKEECNIQWFDTPTDKWQLCYKLPLHLSKAKLTVLNYQILFFLQENGKVYMLDLFSQSPCITESVPMLNERLSPGVGVIDNCLYVVGGCYEYLINAPIKSAEFFNYSTQNWQMISEMSTEREGCGVGVLNNHLYAVGGYGIDGFLKSVERYCPRTDTWVPVADMNEKRYHPGIGILNGVIYAVGGEKETGNLNSVEAYNPSSNTWTFVNKMHIVRNDPEVAALNGLLYVVSWDNGCDNYSAEIYNPKSNIWTMMTQLMNIKKLVGAVIVNKPPYFKT